MDDSEIDLHDVQLTEAAGGSLFSKSFLETVSNVNRVLHQGAAAFVPAHFAEWPHKPRGANECGQKHQVHAAEFLALVPVLPVQAATQPVLLDHCADSVLPAFASRLLIHLRRSPHPRSPHHPR